METTEKLIRVTPPELEAVFDRLEAEHTTRLAIIGPQMTMSSDSPDFLRGFFQLSEPWPGLVGRVIRLRHLDRLVLW